MVFISSVANCLKILVEHLSQLQNVILKSTKMSFKKLTLQNMSFEKKIIKICNFKANECSEL